MERLIDKIGNLFEYEKPLENNTILLDGTIEDIEEMAILNEAIPVSEYRKWYKKLKGLKGHANVPDGGDYRTRFNSWFPAKKEGLSNKWRVFIPFGGKIKSNKKIKTPEDIERALKELGWSIEDYSTGQAVRKAGAKQEETKSEEWSPRKQYKARDFVNVNGKIFKAIKNPTIGVSPLEDKEKQWLDFQKVAGGAGKEERKSIGSILTAALASAKKEGSVAKEKLYHTLERKNQTLQDRISSMSKDTGEVSTDKYVVISRHPYDVMGASTDRAWSSCQNVGVGKEDYMKTKERINIKEWIKDKKYNAGESVIYNDKIYKSRKGDNKETPKSGDSWSIDDTFKVTSKKDQRTGKIVKVATRNFEMVPSMKGGRNCKIGSKGEYYHGIGADVRYGAMVAYLVNSDDVDINNPLSRLLIKPYIKMSGANAGSVYLFTSQSPYGVGGRVEDDKIFRKTVEDWLEDHQTGEGVYKIKQERHSSGESMEDQSWEGHYPEEPGEMRPKDYNSNKANVREFKDGLTWQDVIDYHRWFAKNEFSNAVLGEEYGILIMYSGEVNSGTWNDKAETRSGELNNVNIANGKFNNTTLSSCKTLVGEFNKCTINEGELRIRAKIFDTKVNDVKITGSINAKNSKFKNITFENIPGDSKLTFENCEIENSKDLQGTFIKCTFVGNDVTFSEKVTIKDATFDGINLDGGKFSGILKSGELKNVDIEKIVMTGGKLIDCEIKHGIIKNGILQNCDFYDGIFGYTEKQRKKGEERKEEIPSKKSSNRSKFFGGNFYGGVFAGGDFIPGKYGKFHKEAKWVNGTWHGSLEGKPAKAKAKLGLQLKGLKGLDLAKRLSGSKHVKKEKEEEE